MFYLEDNYYNYLISKGLKPLTIKDKKRNLRAFFDYLKANRKETDARYWEAEILYEYFDYLKKYRYRRHNNDIERALTNRRIRQQIYDVKKYAAYLFGNDKLIINPFEKVVILKTGKNLITCDINEQDVDKLLNVVDTRTYLGYRNRTILELLYGSGLRRAEVTKLNIEDVYFEEGKLLIRESKGDKDREIPLGKVSSFYLQEYIRQIRPYLSNGERNKEKALFLNRRGSRLHAISIGRMVKEYAKVAGLKDITTHKLRHAFALHMMRKGCDVRYIRDMLGHKYLKTTVVYTKVFDYDLRQKILEYHPMDHKIRLKISFKIEEKKA